MSGDRVGVVSLRAAVAAVAVLAVLLLTGCPGGELNFFQEKEEYILEIRNETDQPVEIFFVRKWTPEEELFERLTVQAEQSSALLLAGPCDEGEFEFAALSDDGTELERLTPPICDGDVWVIAGPGAPL